MCDLEEIKTKFYEYSLKNMFNRFEHQIDIENTEEILELDFIEFIYKNKDKYVTDEFTINDFATLLFSFQKELIKELEQIANEADDIKEETENDISEELKLHIKDELRE